MSIDYRELPSLATCLLSAEPASVPVGAAPLSGARACWSPSEPSATPSAHAGLAIEICEDGPVRAWVDRYGGWGIGGNGGSGRAAVYQGYHLKGVGPTPLIGRTTDKQHVSGGTYLEEAVRETIWGEILAAELPWGAVRTKAIIDTLRDQHWPPDPNVRYPVERERRVILVREIPLRLAHFQRAPYFTGPDELAGPGDVDRVSHNRSVLEQRFGAAGFESLLRQFWTRWAEQCGYLFAVRLAHGPPAPSNVALDGRLLDFGGMCSLPDWGGIKLYPGFFEHNDVFPRLASCLHDFYAEHDDGGLTDGAPAHDYASSLAERCREVYFKTIGVEMLRLAGLRRETINSVVGDETGDSRVIDAVTKAMTFYLRHFRDSVEAADASELWDFERFWDEHPPAHLRALRAVADEMAVRARGEPITRRMVSRCWPKAQLYHEHFRLNLQELLPDVQPGAPVDEDAIAAVVTRQIVAARRDSKFEPHDGYLCGFAATATAVYSLFRNEDGVSAVDESSPAAEGGAAPSIVEPVPFSISAGNIDGRPVIEIRLFDS